MDRFQKLLARALEKDLADIHPDPDLLAAFAENSLASGERGGLFEHLSSCSDCRQILYLASPPTDQLQTVSQAPPRRFRLLIGWGTAASMAVLVIVFTVQYTAHKQPGPAPVQMAAKQEPRELDRLPAANQARANRDEDRQSARPVEKHMTAKPEAKLRFDASGQVHVAAPAAPLPEQALSAQLGKKEDLPDAKMPKDELAADSEVANNRIKSTNESVVVSGATPVVQGNAAESKRERTARQNAPARADGGIAASQAGPLSPHKLAAFPQWRLSSEGGVERSTDSGKTWTPVSIAEGVVLKALSFNGADIWAGGKGGILYHSQDAGVGWTQVRLQSGGQELENDITQIQFSDPMNGSLATQSGETWITSDGGNSWSRK